MLNLENKTYVIMGIANKRSIAFGVAKVLDQLGAKLVLLTVKNVAVKSLKIIRTIKSTRSALISN